MRAVPEISLLVQIVAKTFQFNNLSWINGMNLPFTISSSDHFAPTCHHLPTKYLCYTWPHWTLIKWAIQYLSISIFFWNGPENNSFLLLRASEVSLLKSSILIYFPSRPCIFIHIVGSFAFFQERKTTLNIGFLMSTLDLWNTPARHPGHLSFIQISCWSGWNVTDNLLQWSVSHPQGLLCCSSPRLQQ